MTLRPGTPVLIPPRKGWDSPTYAVISAVLTPNIVRVVTTADSGGRRNRSWYDMPRTRVQVRRRGQHRRPRPRPWWRLGWHRR